jgi:hypothetical protein
LHAALREFAEDAQAYLGTQPGQEKVETERYVAVHSPTTHPQGGLAMRIRFGDDFDGGVAEVRDWFRRRGRDAFTWIVGPSTTPPDARDRLLAAGAEPLEGFETSTCMVLTHAPAPVRGVEVRVLETLEEQEQTIPIIGEVFDLSEEHRNDRLALVRRHWASTDPRERETFGAFVDGELVAVGISTYTDRGVLLGGGATLERARGRGAYTALVRARWDAAVARGTPALAVHASAMSAPILAHLGFEPVATIELLRDSATLPP